jgi:hypothetical protein
MKISKDRLKQIINEELVLAEQEQVSGEEGDDALAKTKSEFGNKLLELSKQVRNLRGLDATEMQALLQLMVDLTELASAQTAGPTLLRIQKKISQMIGAK